jgi:hypothetical protein
MNKLNVIGVGLAKNVIQESVLSRSNWELQNRALSRCKPAEYQGSAAEDGRTARVTGHPEIAGVAGS